MSRIIALIVTFLVAFGSPTYAWKFVSMADSRGSNNGVNTSTLNGIITRVNAENPDLVIFQGDAVNGESDDATLISQMNTWLSYMSKLNAPWYFVPGNHEISRSTSENVLRSKLAMPTNGPSGYEETVYSFDYLNAHFVGLNSNHYGQVHHVQRTWLKTDLANTTQPHVFVMAHEPAYPYGPHKGSSLDVYATERDDFWNIMTTGRAAIYFCGHEHLYGRSKRGSIYQVVNGSCGAPLNSGYSGTTAQYHYVVVDVNGYNVTCTAKNSSGSVIDSWSYSVTPPPPPPTTGTPNIKLTIIADRATVLPGQAITYTITYSNIGDGKANSVLIENTLPTSLTYVTGSATSSGTYNSTTRKMAWTLPAVAAGVSGTLQFKVTVN
ncbi:MAG: metallophosphoesterase [Armatimonadota bacterium]|nr:metallophosphoesterase [Armatimonadota bacterium]